MNPLFKIGGKLAAICVVAAFTLGVVNAFTAPRIARIQEERLQAALEAVSGGMRIGEAIDVQDDPVVARYYVLYGNGDSIEGYICSLVGAGYGGDMMILARYGLDGTIEAVKMMRNLETPGLGKEAEKDSYMEMFIGSGSEKQVPVRKDMLSPEESDAVTGATVTFIGIGKALENGSRFVAQMEDQQDD